jgi:hypothetical protein
MPKLKTLVDEALDSLERQGLLGKRMASSEWHATVRFNQYG